MKGSGVIKEVGYPDEMQVREAMIQACYDLGSKAAFCEKVGLSQRYFNLIMEWKRAPVHWKLLQYFGWSAVYAVPEDLLDPPPRQKSGRRPLSATERAERHLAIDFDKRRAYYAQKQREFRERRRLQQIRSL